MTKILIINAYYYPGYRSGGPQQTIMNLVDVLGDQYEFYILTHNHDLGEIQPYENINEGQWNNVGKAKVYYYQKNKFSLRFLRKFLEQFPIVYLCEPYRDHSYKTLLLNRFNFIHTRIILAPMGCLSKGALMQKSLKKKIFWNVSSFMGLFKKICWSLTSDLEKEDAINVIGHVNNYYIAEDLPRKYIDYHEKRTGVKNRSELKIIFLSRICHKKNLIMAIDIVSKLRGQVVFDLYGTREDSDYWKSCCEKLERLPSNIRWTYKGEVLSEKVVDTFSKYDVFLFPTLGENFGHVIYEALMSGCVPVISNTTPWLDLDVNRCGNVIDLEHKDIFQKILQEYIDMDREDFIKNTHNAMNYAKRKYETMIRKSEYSKMFEDLDI